MALDRHDAVLLVAHGTVTDLDDLPAFLAKIRHGRPAPEPLLSELRRRYEAVGGSPLLDITRAQTAALGRKLDAPVFCAMRLWHPTVEEVLTGIDRLGLARLAIVPLAPFSIDVYWRAACASLANAKSNLTSEMELVRVEPWGLEPAFISTHVERIRTSIAAEPSDTSVILTAHSLPSRIVAAGDAYEREFLTCARAIGAELTCPWRVAFQSQGADGGEWLGPNLRTAMEEVAKGGVRRVVLSPVGFVAEHVETLYDLDVEAVTWAKELGLTLSRVPALNTDPGLIEALASAATSALAGPAG